MSGLGIEALPWPERRYRIDLHDPRFELEIASIDEDRTRARILRAGAAQHGGDWGRMALALADKIDPDISPEIPDSPASARYMRYHRIKIIGALWKLLDEVGLLDVRRCDIIREGWNLDLDQFLDERPARLKNEFRSTLVRARAALKRKGTDTSGRFFFAGLHGEYNSSEQTFQLHYHALEEHAHAVVVDSLRDRAGFVSPRRGDAADHGAADSHVTTPVRITRRRITNLASALGYLIKSYWLQYPRKRSGSGSKKSNNRGKRIESPFLSVQLLWMDQCRLADLIIMIGMRVTKHGLRLTRGVHE